MATQFYEVPDYKRAGWSDGIIVDGREFNTKPMCYAWAFSLSDEIHALHEQGNDLAEAVNTTMFRDRKCKEWYQWTPGFSPQEHMQTLRFQKTEDDRRRFEQRMEADRRRFDKWIAIAVIVFALIEAGAAIASLPSDSWFLGFVGRVFQFIVSLL